MLFATRPEVHFHSTQIVILVQRRTKHDCYIIDQNGKGSHRELPHSPESISSWVAEMLQLADGGPIAIMLEQSWGALIHTLMFRENVPWGQKTRTKLTLCGNHVFHGV